jgi:hypothetical protein
LAAATAVAELAFEAIERNALAQGHLAQVFTRVALHVATFANKPNHGHGNPWATSAF